MNKHDKDSGAHSTLLMWITNGPVITINFIWCPDYHPQTTTGNQFVFGSIFILYLMSLNSIIIDYHNLVQKKNKRNSNQNRTPPKKLNVNIIAWIFSHPPLVVYSQERRLNQLAVNAVQWRHSPWTIIYAKYFTFSLGSVVENPTAWINHFTSLNKMVTTTMILQIFT